MNALKHELAKRRSRAFVNIAGAAVLALCVPGCLGGGTPPPEISFKQTETDKNAPPSRTGWDYLEADAPRQAIPLFQSALTKNASDEKSLFGLAEALRKSGQSEPAEAQYAKLLTSQHYRIDALSGIGYVKLSNFDQNGAFEMFSTATKESPRAWKAWLGLAQLSDLAGDWGAADEAYGRALSSSPDRAFALNNKGVSMLARGKPEIAIALFEEAHALDPGAMKINTNIELASMARNGAIDGLNNGDSDARKRAKKLNNWGYAAMLRGDLQQAEVFLNEAIRAHPSFYPVAHKNLQSLMALRN